MFEPLWGRRRGKGRDRGQPSPLLPASESHVEACVSHLGKYVKHESFLFFLNMYLNVILLS